MTLLSLKLSRALSRGRGAAAPATRAGVLEILLRKRAAAHNTGDAELELLLRDQIKWSLPIEAVD